MRNIGLVRIRRRMKDEQKLKEFRLKETDEREQEVDSLALRAAAKFLLAALYVLLIAAGVFERAELVYALLLTWVLTKLFNSEKVMFAK